MMGVNMGYRPGPKLPGITKKYAVFPTGTDSGKCLWLQHYWEIKQVNIETFKEEELILTEKEYLVWRIKNSYLFNKA